MLVVTIMGTEVLGRSLRLQFGSWAISFAVDTCRLIRVDMYGLDSDTAALRLSLPFPLPLLAPLIPDFYSLSVASFHILSIHFLFVPPCCFS
jgi:hypothetical protein